MRPYLFVPLFVFASLMGTSNAQTAKNTDGLAGLANSNPTVKKKIADEKRRDDAISSAHDATTGPAGSSGAVQRTQKAMIDDALDRAGLNSTKQMNDAARKKMYDERAKQLMVEETARQDAKDRAEMEQARQRPPSAPQKRPVKTVSPPKPAPVERPTSPITF